MTANTISANRRMTHFDDHRDLWLFGYGSLIFKVDFPFIESRPASIRHWERRFWQGSHDHRGTPSAPGRVVTLTAVKNAVCRGVAYRISPEVFDALDYREKNGYLRFVTELTFEADGTAEGLVYIATEDNPAFLGPASEQQIARHIASSAGPSGRNRDYVIALADALRKLDTDDPHVFAVADYLG